MPSAHYATFPEACDEIVARLRARTGLDGVQIEDGWPGEEADQANLIWVDDAYSSDTVAGMRRGPINNNESYSIFVICDSFVEGGDSRAARDAVFVLVGEVLAECSETKRVPGVNVSSLRGAGWKFRPYALKTGRGAAVRVELKVGGRR